MCLLLWWDSSSPESPGFQEGHYLLINHVLTKCAMKLALFSFVNVDASVEFRIISAPMCSLQCYMLMLMKIFKLQATALVNSGLLLMAVMGLLFPAVLHFTHTEVHFGKSELALSRFSSCIMLVAYASYLFFQLKSQPNLYRSIDEVNCWKSWNRLIAYFLYYSACISPRSSAVIAIDTVHPI